jgi:hypothetical protein
VTSDKDIESIGNTEDDRLSDQHDFGSVIEGSVDFDVTKSKSHYRTRNRPGIDSSVRSNRSDESDPDFGEITEEEGDDYDQDSGTSQHSYHDEDDNDPSEVADPDELTENIQTTQQDEPKHRRKASF